MVPGFILKLWKMINDHQCDDLISWSDNGQSFIIMDPPRFSQELSKYFKHNNLSSFIRQLNMYGFRKVATIENSGLHTGQEDLHFYHPDFVRNKPERLEAIKRKLPQKVAESVDYKNIVRGLTELGDKQKDVTKSLSDIKRENEMLWAELHDLRQKHQQQEHYISRLMKLVFDAMEQNGIRTNTLPFEGPLMIEGGDTQVSPSPATASNTAPLLDDTTSYTITKPEVVDTLNAQNAILLETMPQGTLMDTCPSGSLVDPTSNGGIQILDSAMNDQPTAMDSIQNISRDIEQFNDDCRLEDILKNMSEGHLADFDNM